MSAPLSPPLLPPLGSVLLSVPLVALAWQNRQHPLALPFAALTVAIGLWSATAVGAVVSGGRTGTMFWERTALTVSAFVPSIWLVLTLRYSGREEWLGVPLYAGLAAENLTFAALVWTNGAHRLVWTGTETVAAGRSIVFSFATGYYLHLAYSYAVVVTGVALLLVVYHESSRIYSRQATLLSLGAVVPLAANVAVNLGYNPFPGVDLTTATFTVTDVVFGLALFQFDLLDLVPVARRNVSEELGDATLVFDADRRLVDYNRNADTILEDLRDGAAAEQVLPTADFDALEGTTMSVETAGDRRYFLLRSIDLEDFRGRTVGHLVVMRDVSDRKEYEQRLEVVNRLLRHNLRNAMSSIIGHAEDIARTTDGRTREGAEVILETAERVATLREKAQVVEETIAGPGADTVAVEAVAVVERVVGRYRWEFPDADISVTAPQSAWTSTLDEELLEVAVENAVDNAVRHHDGDPTVRVRVESDDGSVLVSVTDDGPGVPPEEVAVIERGWETELEHGSGLGLWLLHWILTASGGRVEVVENEPRGTVVRMSLPAAEPPGDPRAAPSATD